MSKSNFKKYLIPLVLILVFIIFVVWAVFLPKSFSSQEKVLFQVEKGEGSKEISHNLERQGLVWWAPLFRAYTMLIGVSRDLQAGNYQLSSSMNLFTLVQKLVRGDVAREEITIIEGWNLKDIAWYFENKGMFQAEELFELNGNSWQGGLEGYLFPDTYLVNYGASLAEIIQQMKDNFDKRTAGLAITPEIITMASLIEKEVRTEEDKEIVSGIFWKRLETGIPLESCATIAYIKGVDQWRYSYEDTRIESPYNTYLNYGLPPTPIANPGLESIISALNPQKTEYWYWLSTPDDGETIFTKTLAEHNYAKSIYLK